MAISLLVFAGPVSADDLDVLRMSEVKRNQLFSFLENNHCTCGCDMTLETCLRDDPECPVSPKIALSAIQQLMAGGEEQSIQGNSGSGSGGSTYINSTQTGSVVSGSINGQECTYVTAGGMTFKDCE